MARLEPLLPDHWPCRDGRWADHRMVINGVIWRSRSGSAWRDSARGVRELKTVYNRHHRWSVERTWERILDELRRGADLDEVAV